MHIDSWLGPRISQSISFSLWFCLFLGTTLLSLSQLSSNNRWIAPQIPFVCPFLLLHCNKYEPYLSLVTLAVQDTTLSIIMDYSRVSIPSALAYSPASAVLLSVLEGSISFIIALIHSPVLSQDHPQHYLHIRHCYHPLRL